jgi:CubicO group peptidase (beta-lactamase class C family)
MKLQELGRLNITDPVTKFIPNATNWKDIKIYHLLGHTSGIQSDAGFSATDPENLELSDIMERIMVLPLSFEPGTNYTYSNNGYITLSYIIGQASGMSYTDYLEKTFFEPLGMNSTGQDNSRDVFINRTSGYTTMDGKYVHYDLQNIHNTWGAGCLHSTTEDLYRWIRAFNTPGAILSQDSLNEMMKNQYGIIVNTVQNRTMIFHSGRQFGFISQTFSVPEDNVSIVYLSNHDRTPTGTVTMDLMSIVYGKPYSLPVRIERKAVPVPQEKITGYSGVYEPAWEKTWTFTVYSVDNRTFYQSVMPRETVEIFYEGNDTFFMTPESNDSITFKRADDGNISSMELYMMEGSIDVLDKV